MSSNLKSQSHLRRNKSVPLCFPALPAIVCVSPTRRHRVFLQRGLRTLLQPSYLLHTLNWDECTYVFCTAPLATASNRCKLLLYVVTGVKESNDAICGKTVPFGDGTNARVGINGDGEQCGERAGVPILKNFLDCKEFYCFGTKEQVVRQEISASHLGKFLVWISRRETLETTQISIKSEKTCWGKKTDELQTVLVFRVCFPHWQLCLRAKLPTIFFNHVDR